LDAVRQDVVENATAFRDEDGEGVPDGLVDRYRVNLLVDNSETSGAPVIYEDLPSHQHLVGLIEHHVSQGALYTDFSLIRAGALHRANGGYLLIDVRRVLTQPLAWESLKRVLFSGRIRIESLERLYGLVSTVSLQPEPIPVDVKVVLLGDRLLYYLLSRFDPDFLELFKVEADFEDDVDRTRDGHEIYARMIATMARRAELRPLDRGGVARVIEHASRLADDQQKLTAHDRDLRDLLMEADHWAGQAGADHVSAEHVEQAVSERIQRANRIHQRSLEAIRRGTVLIATEGERVAQVNGLSVFKLGAFAFGQPSRITATARPGKGQVVDIEREAKLGGPIHSKGVMILSRFLAHRYAAESELSLSASLAFEQSYGGVEGDSASVAELCALLSAIARVPLRQSLAVTGSVNQHGEVQAVGGVNQKIEGFFDVCREAGGLDGHGVLLPASNVEHLMLRHDVREAVEKGDFRIYPITTIDDALALLTGREPGPSDAEGRFPEDSLNRLVADRLDRFAEIGRKRHTGGDDEQGGNRPDDD
ncbi:MAG: Lon protease family protein, partial [Wenzhouxiangella sp.]